MGSAVSGMDGRTNLSVGWQEAPKKVKRCGRDPVVLGAHAELARDGLETEDVDKREDAGVRPRSGRSLSLRHTLTT
jgi:hypothetical protein